MIEIGMTCHDQRHNRIASRIATMMSTRTCDATVEAQTPLFVVEEGLSGGVAVKFSRLNSVQIRNDSGIRNCSSSPPQISLFPIRVAIGWSQKQNMSLQSSIRVRHDRSKLSQRCPRAGTVRMNSQDKGVGAGLPTDCSLARPAGWRLRSQARCGFVPQNERKASYVNRQPEKY